MDPSLLDRPGDRIAPRMVVGHIGEPARHSERAPGPGERRGNGHRCGGERSDSHRFDLFAFRAAGCLFNVCGDEATGPGVELYLLGVRVWADRDRLKVGRQPAVWRAAAKMRSLDPVDRTVLRTKPP